MKKNTIYCVAFLCILMLIFGVFIGYLWATSEKQKTEKTDEVIMEKMKQENDEYFNIIIEALSLFDIYKQDSEAQELYQLLKITHSFMDAQISVLNSYMDELTYDINDSNYQKSYNQLLLCEKINLVYNDSYTRYFDLLKNEYKILFCHIEEVEWYGDIYDITDLTDYNECLRIISLKLDFVKNEVLT